MQFLGEHEFLFDWNKLHELFLKDPSDDNES